MALPVRKGYSGSGVSTTLTSSPTESDTTFTVTAVTNWPNTYPFFIAVDPGTAKEEKMRVTGVSTLTVTVVRGQDNTSAVAHNSGATCYPVFTAEEANEANDIASTMTTKGDIITTDGSDINRLAVGTNAHVLQADSTTTNGIKWGTVVADGLASDSVTTAKIANDAVTTGKIDSGAVTLAKLATAVQNLLVPVGTISPYAGAVAPTGWLLCDGTSTSGYTALTALVGATTPDLRGRTLIGAGTGVDLTARTLGTAGGFETHTLTVSEMPSHTHTQNQHAHKVSTSFINVQTGGTTIYPVDPSGLGTAYDSSLGFTAVNQDTGGGSAHNNMQPFHVVNYIIKHD